MCPATGAAGFRVPIKSDMLLQLVIERQRGGYADR
jgi:hypothetical protein